MRLLLTRAAGEAARTGVTLEALGHRVLVSPVIHYMATGERWLRRPPQGLLATSARAFIDVTPDDVVREGWQMVPLYLTGSRTLEAARASGFVGPAGVAPDSAGLAAILRPLPASRLLYWAGTDRKSGLEEAIHAGNRHRLTVLETYSAGAAEALTPDAQAALLAGTVDAILHYSRRSAAIFTRLASGADIDVTQFVHVCLSHDTAAPLHASGCGRLRIAAEPGEAAMLRLLDP